MRKIEFALVMIAAMCCGAIWAIGLTHTDAEIAKEMGRWTR